METVIARFSRHPSLVCLFFVIFIAGGIWALLHLPIDAFPDVANNQVQILTEAPGMGPLEVEQLVTIPLESIMNGLPSVQQVRSISKYGLSVITVVFPDNLGIYFPRQRVLERLESAKARLPEKIDPQLAPVSTAMGEIYQYVLESNRHTPTELKTIQEWDIKYALRTVPGVAEVNTWGGFTDEYLVTIIPGKLQLYGLTIKDVLAALKNNNDNFGAGIINHESEQYIVRGLGRANSTSDIENIIVKSDSAAPIYIKNLGYVSHGAAPRQGAATKDGQGEVVVGLIMMLKGENSMAVIDRVKKKILQLKDMLPEGIVLKPFYDQSKLVEQTIDTVKINLLEGGFLVIAVLLLMVGNLRAALIVASAIPLSMTFSFLGMHALGVTANIMSLGAIDFGMIVDGSIVMMENILRNLGDQPTYSEMKRGELAVRNAASIRASGQAERRPGSAYIRSVIENSIAEVARPILFGVLIIAVVYIPILCLEGIEYKMFAPMVITVCSALLGSLLISLFLVPVLAQFFLDIKHTEKTLGL